MINKRYFSDERRCKDLNKTNETKTMMKQKAEAETDAQVFTHQEHLANWDHVHVFRSRINVFNMYILNRSLLQLLLAFMLENRMTWAWTCVSRKELATRKDAAWIACKVTNRSLFWFYGHLGKYKSENEWVYNNRHSGKTSVEPNWYNKTQQHQGHGFDSFDAQTFIAWIHCVLLWMSW